MIPITVETENDARTTKQRWQFRYDDSKRALMLTCYFELHRPTRRHKYRAEKSYQASFRNHSNLTLEQVPFTAWVTREALTSFTDNLRVLRGDEK